MGEIPGLGGVKCTANVWELIEKCNGHEVTNHDNERDKTADN